MSWPRPTEGTRFRSSPSDVCCQEDHGRTRAWAGTRIAVESPHERSRMRVFATPRTVAASALIGAAVLGGWLMQSLLRRADWNDQRSPCPGTVKPAAYCSSATPSRAALTTLADIVLRCPSAPALPDEISRSQVRYRTDPCGVNAFRMSAPRQ